MQTIKIIWPLLLVGIVVLCLSYIKMREKIPTYKRERIEKIAMLLLILFLLIDIGFAIKQRRDMTMEVNDCIRFYRYFPNFVNDTEFYFISKCDDYFDEEGIERLRDSGRVWYAKQLEGGVNLYE